jgi:hypothetical protein
MKAVLKLKDKAVVTLTIPGRTPAEVRAADGQGKATWDGNETIIAQAKLDARSCYAPVAPSWTGLEMVCGRLRMQGLKDAAIVVEDFDAPEPAEKPPAPGVVE